jgi:hypothetical protein
MPSASKSELHPQLLGETVRYYSGEMSPRERARFEKHLAACPGCARAVATARVIFPEAQALLAVPEPRLSTDQLLARMEFERRRVTAGQDDPARERTGFTIPQRWLLALAPTVAIAVLLVLRVTLFSGPGFTLAAPQRPAAARPRTGPAPSPPVDLYAAGPENVIRPLPAGAVLEIAGDGKIHLWAKGDPSDRELLLMAQDAAGRLAALWPGGKDRRGAPCPGSCEHLELAVEARTLTPGTTRAVLWIGPGPLDASGVSSLGRGESPMLAGARASTWFELNR